MVDGWLAFNNLNCERFALPSAGTFAAKESAAVRSLGVTAAPCGQGLDSVYVSNYVEVYRSSGQSPLSRPYIAGCSGLANKGSSFDSTNLKSDVLVIGEGGQCNLKDISGIQVAARWWLRLISNHS